MTTAEYLAKLAPEIAKITAADFRFFRRHPHRRHRIRLAGRAECQEAWSRCGLAHALPLGCEALIGVRRDEGSIRRVIGFARQGHETDLTEGEAREAFAILAEHFDETLEELREQAIAEGLYDHLIGVRGRGAQA